MKNTPNVLGIIPEIIPSTYMHTIKPLSNLRKQRLINCKVLFESQVKLKELEWANIVLFNRNVQPHVQIWLDYLNKNNIPFIYDLDDNFFLISTDTKFGLDMKFAPKLETLKRILSESALVRVYSSKLEESISEFTDRYHKVAGPVDWSVIDRSPQKSNRIKIVYSTSRVVDNLGFILLDPLERIINLYQDKLEIHFWGSNPLQGSRLPNVVFHPFTWDYDNYLRKFSRQHYDIGLAPLLIDDFHRSKTEVKYREYGACSVAGIYTDVDVYSKHIISGQNGLLVNNDSAQWFEAIKSLVQNSEVRMRIQNNALEDTRKKYSQQSFDKILLFDIETILNNCKKPKIRKRQLININNDENTLYHQVNSLWQLEFRNTEYTISKKVLKFISSYLKRCYKTLWLKKKLLFK